MKNKKNPKEGSKLVTSDGFSIKFCQDHSQQSGEIDSQKVWEMVKEIKRQEIKAAK